MEIVILIVIYIMGILLVCPLLGLLAHKVPNRFHLSIRVILVVAGLTSFFLPLPDGKMYFLIGLGLIMAGVLFMPFKKQVELLLDVLPIP